MLKNGKAPGIDEVVSECLKKEGNKLFQQLHRLTTDIWEQEEIPESWKMSVLCPVYKKGDKMDPKNYRGISLLNTSYKILSNLLLNRLKPFIKEIIGEYQAGFMKKSHEFNKDVHMLFVDFKAAYDSVDRKKLWNIMSRLGIPEKLTRIIKVCVQGSKCNSMVRQVLSKAEGLKLSDDKQLTIVAYADDLEEIRERLIAANRCYFGLSILFKSKLLSRRSNTTLYNKVLIRPIALYVCETKILRKIFGPKKNEGGEFEIGTNEELRELFGEADIIGIMKSSRIRWAGHVWRSEVLGSITKWKPNTKRPRGRPRQQWADRVKDDLRMIGVKNAEEMSRQGKVEGCCCCGNGP
ncbi:Reverse transcriptase domain [Cinara cedri]|uniref:Reverse transcriptase domain n=1 Tax=Cinara cedri TaxID=506608 RepID=A0A5E4MLZ1_9HEMI|nr:Reverse transcriptase domain [Cinara cedri]